MKSTAAAPPDRVSDRNNRPRATHQHSRQTGEVRSNTHTQNLIVVPCRSRSVHGGQCTAAAPACFLVQSWPDPNGDGGVASNPGTTAASASNPGGQRW